MKKKINVRCATTVDNALLADLGARTFQESFGADNTPENMAAYLAASFSPDLQAAELNDPSVVFLIAESDGTVAGYAQLRDGEPPTCINGPRPVELVRILYRTALDAVREARVHLASGEIAARGGLAHERD